MPRGGIPAGVARLVAKYFGEAQTLPAAKVNKYWDVDNPRRFDTDEGARFNVENEVDQEGFIINELDSLAKEKNVPVNNVLDEFEAQINARQRAAKQEAPKAAQGDLRLTRVFDEATPQSTDQLPFPTTVSGVGKATFVPSQGATKEFPRNVGEQPRPSSPYARSGLDETTVNPTEKDIHGIIEAQDVPGFGRIATASDFEKDFFQLQQSVNQRLRDFSEALGQPSNTKKKVGGIQGNIRDKIDDWTSRRDKAVEGRDPQALEDIIDEFDDVMRVSVEKGDVEAGARRYFRSAAKRRASKVKAKEGKARVRKSEAKGGVSFDKRQQGVLNQAQRLQDTVSNATRPLNQTELGIINRTVGRETLAPEKTRTQLPTAKKKPSIPDPQSGDDFINLPLFRSAGNRESLEAALRRIGKAETPPRKKKESRLDTTLEETRELNKIQASAARAPRPKLKEYPDPTPEGKKEAHSRLMDLLRARQLKRDPTSKDKRKRTKPSQKNKPAQTPPPKQTLEEEIAEMVKRREELKANPPSEKSLTKKEVAALKHAREQFAIADRNKARLKAVPNKELSPEDAAELHFAREALNEGRISREDFELIVSGLGKN